jgi:hypothetical protein
VYLNLCRFSSNDTSESKRVCMSSSLYGARSDLLTLAHHLYRRLHQYYWCVCTSNDRATHQIQDIRVVEQLH